MNNSYVAEPLVKRIIKYMEKLWTTDQGLQVPQLLNAAPSYLMEAVKREAYGKHLLEVIKNYFCCGIDLNYRFL